MIERIDGDASALGTLYSRLIAGVLANTLLLTGLLFVLWRMSWVLGASISVFCVLTIVLLWHMRRVAVPRWAGFRQVYAEFFGELGEWLDSTEDIRANGAGPYILSRFHKAVRRVYQAHRRSGMMRFGLMAAGTFLYSAGTAVALGIGAGLYLQAKISIGTLYLVFAYAEMARTPLDAIRNDLQDFQRAAASGLRVKNLLSTGREDARVALTGPARLASPGPVHIAPAGPLAVALRDVSFSYGDGEEVLDRVTFSVDPGRVLGLIGRTGSGKTTIARLILNMYSASSGEVCVGGVPVGQAPLEELRSRVALVTQDVQVFRASVRDNLAFFSRKIPDEHLVQALREIGLSGWYDSLENGLDTLIGAGATGPATAGLSAGQAQLLAFARVLLRNPGLVVLDEATSRLDPATESVLEAAQTKLFTGRTGIIIAHRLSTVDRAHDILVLGDGRVIEHGERATLASNWASHYNRLRAAGSEGWLV
ncbi:MAG: ABC transporter ATP-binding protein, partial [Bacillota bacterium]|nr:ABC transporter ATP-binding protein [Bacillota bacterium]